MRRTFAALALVLLALAAGVVWLLRTGSLAESTRARVVEDAARALGREVRVDRIGGDPWRGIVLQGVRIAGGPPGSPAALFEAPRAVLWFDVGRLVRDLAAGRGAAASLIRVELERPVLMLSRDGAGRWNYADLLARQRGVTTAPAAFRAQVEVREGALVFSDALRLPQRAGPSPPSPFAAHVDRITGTLDFSPSPLVGIALDAVNTDGHTPALLRVVGRAALGEATFDLDLTTRGGSVAYWGPYLVRLPWLVWGGGTFDGTLHLLASRWGSRIALDYRGQLVMRDGRALLLPRRTLLSDIDGPLAVDNLGVTTPGLTMAVDASPVSVTGRISHYAGVRMDLALRSSALDLRTLQALLFPRAQIRLAGRAGGEARLVGRFESPRLEGEIRQAAGTVNRQGFADLSGRFTYYGGLLVFDDLSARAGGGLVAGHLRLDTARRGFFVLAQTRGVDARVVSGLGIRLDPTMRGAATGVVAAGLTEGALIAQGRLAVGSGSAFGFAFDRLDALFAYDRGRIEIDRAAARSGRTQVSGEGTIARGGAVDVAVRALDINLRTVADRFGLRRWLAGTTDLQGRLEGTLQAPALSGTVRAREGRLGPFPYDDARGRIRITTTELSTPGLILFDGVGRYFAQGAIRWAGEPTVDLTARANDVAAQRLLEIAEVPLRLGGTVESTVRLSGPLSRPIAQGTAELRHGHVEGQPVDAASAVFRWTGAQLILDEFRARVNASTVTASGTVSRTGQLGIRFAAANLKVEDIAAIRASALQAAGQVDLAGRLGGTLGAPVISATASSTTLVLNGQPFDRAEGRVSYRRGRLALAPLVLAQGSGTFQLSGDILLREDPVLNMRIAARGAPLEALLGLGQVRGPFTLRGVVDGDVTAVGPLSNPRATLDVRIPEARLGEHVIRDATIQAELTNHAVTLRTFRLAADEGELVAAGRIDLRGRSEVEFGGSGLALDLLRPLFGVRRPLAGTLDFTLQLTGELNDPLVGLSATATNGAVGAASFDRLTLQAFYRNGQLNVEHGLLQEDRHRVRLTGTVPFNPARLRSDAAQPMNLRLELVDADLSVLSLLTDRVEQAQGPLAGEVAITGTVAQPHLEGTVAVRGGTLKLRGLEPVLTEVTGQATLVQDEIRIGSLQGRAGEGRVAVTGTVALRRFRPDRLALQLTAESARLSYAPVFAGIVDGRLSIGGTAARPEIGGALTLSHGDLAAPAAARPGGLRPAAGTTNPILDVELRAGEALWVAVGGLRLQVHGSVHATGTWRQPELAGEVTADRGTFTAFNNTFTLTEGRAAFAEFRGTTPFVDARAETRISVAREVRTATGVQRRLEPVRVFLHVSGTPDALVLDLTSEPPLSREEIVAGLAQQIGLARLLRGDPLEDVLRAEISNALFGPFSQVVARTFGLDEFAIEYDFVRPLTLRIGKLLIRDLYLTLTSEFGEPRRVVWALEHRVTPSSLVSFSVDNLGEWTVLYRVVYRF